MQGIKPKPTVFKVLDGDRKSRINQNEPKPAPIAPRMPSWLHGPAKIAWREFAPELERLGLLTKIDKGCFLGYCIAYGRMVWSYKKFKKIEIYIRRKAKEKGLDEFEADRYYGKTPYRHYVGTYNKAMDDIRKFAAEFGMSPSSRSRVVVHRSGDNEDDDLFTK